MQLAAGTSERRFRRIRRPGFLHFRDESRILSLRIVPYFVSQLPLGYAVTDKHGVAQGALGAHVVSRKAYANYETEH